MVTILRIALLVAALTCISGFGVTNSKCVRRLSLRPSTSLNLRGGGPLLSIKKFFERKSTKMAAASGGPKIIIAGGPASGKGTQCEFIVKQFGVVHISTGDALREQVQAGTELGKQAKGYMDAGGLVPDDLIIGIVKARLASPDCQTKGWLLDGFPRTGGQAEAMAKAGIKADKFILLNVPDELLIERCVGRRSDPVTGKIYHLKFNPPPEDPEIQKRLVHRSDDTAEAMTKRIDQYKKNVEAVKGYYRDITKEFDGTGDKMKLAAAIADFCAAKSARLGPSAAAADWSESEVLVWDAATAGRNVTISDAVPGALTIAGAGTAIATRGLAALPSPPSPAAAAGAADHRLYWEYDVEETGRGSWVGVVAVPGGGGGGTAAAAARPDLELSLSGIGWAIWGGTTGAIHPMYVAGGIREQTLGFRAGARVGLLLDGAAGTLTYYLDGEEVCVAFEDLPTGRGLAAAAAAGGGAAAAAAAAAGPGGPGLTLYPAASNGWAGVTRMAGRFRPAPPPAATGGGGDPPAR